MRKVFTSIRLENVEGVAQLLRDEGIEVRITHGRSYKGNRRGTFSYRASTQTGPQPAVWVIKSEDQPRARELLRNAGLMESTRSPGGGFLSDSAAGAGPERAFPTPQQRASRIRIALLVVLVVVTVITVARMF